jgi:two-component system cell cycle response regulator DivK
MNKILIVDDEPFSLKTFNEAIGRYLPDIDISNAQSGAEGIRKAIKEQPDTIVLDIIMPVMDGYEATREILKFRPDLPIVAQTAHAYTDNKYESLSNGCIDYLPKPISRDQLMRVLNKYLKRA